jgi:hypothetical protein
LPQLDAAYRLNSDLNKRLREVQQELMAVKGDNLRLNGQNIQQDIQLAHLRELLSLERTRNEQLESRALGASQAQMEVSSTTSRDQRHLLMASRRFGRLSASS